MEIGESNAVRLPGNGLYFSDCPCVDLICSVMILEQKSVHVLNSFYWENGIWQEMQILQRTVSEWLVVFHLWGE